MEKTTGNIAWERFMREIAEAQEKKICNNCGKSVRNKLKDEDSEIDYKTTGLCKTCMKE